MKIENCKYDSVELAHKFIFMAERFLHIIKTDNAILDFEKASVRKNGCGTVACHGGFCAMVFGTDRYYVNGVVALSEFMGFDQYYNFIRWASNNASVWGVAGAGCMFNSDGYRAFGKASGDDVSLADIAGWYLDVAGRLLRLPK